ncbi:hypothetical protein LguiA_023755 [Lonicera macranthoides]
MTNPENRQPINEHNIDANDRVDQSTDSSSVGASSSVGETYAIRSSANSGESQHNNNGSNNEIGLTQRLTNILVDEGDGDLLLQRSDREDRVMRWLQALDMHVMGACRADERLTPLLKLNVSGGSAEDRLLAHLSQHFEPSEVGILARCLCIPLVSIRVGKINKQGTLLCPTGTRGNLTLTLLPTSDLRIAFIGDDGCAERLSTVSRSLHFSSVAIDGIPTDSSGRSFLIKLPDGESHYFWCSEKSRLLGNELLEKMKDLLKRKPSLAELSGISEPRLECFATYIRGYLVGSAVTNTQTSTVVSVPTSDSSVNYPQLVHNAQLASSSSKTSRPRSYNSQGVKPNPVYQGSLSPRSSSFKEGLPKNLSSLRSITKEKLRRRGENHVSCTDNISAASPSTNHACSSNQSDTSKLPESTGSSLFPPSSFLESLGASTLPPFLSTSSQVPSLNSPLLSPYYCWCPPVASTLQYTVTPPQLPNSSTESFSLPPLSSALLASKPPVNLSDIPSVDFPPFLPEPLVRLQLSMTTSQQIPTFTPLMCDSIVHIPVIDICSSGQGYLVSAGPSMSTGITPLHPTLPLIPETDSVVEKNARETLRLLLGNSSQTNPQLMSMLTNCEETQCALAAGSRGLYSGVRDVGSIANSISAMGMVSLSEISLGSSSCSDGVTRRRISQADFVDQLEKSVGGTGGTCSEEGGPLVSNSGDGEVID